MVRTCKYKEPQAKQNIRTTPTGFANVIATYINIETLFAHSVGDLLDEIGQGTLYWRQSINVIAGPDTTLIGAQITYKN